MGLLFNLFLLLIGIVSVCCESQSLNAEKEWELIQKKLQPLKYKSCQEFCQNIVCDTIEECDDGVILKKESYCKCCDVCVKHLDIHQPCKDIIDGSLALGSQTRCRPGTKCKNGKCQLDPAVDGCLRRREYRRKLQGTGNYTKSIWIPQCQNDGKYKSKQKKIRKSICVDESGKRIFGSAESSLDNACGCSRYMEKKKEREGIAYNVKPQEHCSPSGNFETLQCINNLCYCADNKTGQVISPLVRIGFLDRLPCYDSKIHRKTYLKNCEEELQRSRKLSYEFSLKGVKLLGIDRIKCDPDGSYSPTQCTSERCVCTDKDGVGIGSYQEEKTKTLELDMTCTCARGEISAQLSSPFTCLGYGSYNSFTCFDDDCVCVDEDGDGISKELKKSDNVESMCKALIEKLEQQPGDDEDDVDEGDDGDYEYSEEL